MTKNYVIIGLAVVTIFSIVFSGHTYNKYGTYTKEIKKLYEIKLDGLSRQLERSSRSRDSISLVIDRLTADLDYLRILDAKKDAQIDSIKGRFDHLTPTELQKSMIDIYNKSK